MEYLKNENIFNSMPEGPKKMGLGVRIGWNGWHMRKRAELCGKGWRTQKSEVHSKSFSNHDPRSLERNSEEISYFEGALGLMN